MLEPSSTLFSRTPRERVQIVSLRESSVGLTINSIRTLEVLEDSTGCSSVVSTEFL